MDLNHNTTVVIALAIAVTVVMGMMVPIISDTIAMHNTGSGGGGGGNSDNSYVNEGSMYMKSKMASDEVHFLSFINTGSKIEFRMDGETYTEKNITGTDFWSYPIVIIGSETTTDNGSEYTYELISFERDLENNPVISGNLFTSYITENEKRSACGGKQIIFDLTEIEIAEFQFHANGMSILVNTQPIGQDTPYTMFLMTDGDWVVAENPVVNPNQKIYSYGESRGTSNGFTYSAYSYGYGQASYFTDLYYGEIGYGIDPNDEESEAYGYVPGDVQINVELTDTDYGVRLGNVNYTGDWYTDPEEESLFSTDESFNTYIVPKVVKARGETQAGWLTEDAPSEPLSISCREVEPGKMGVFYNYYDMDDPQPFYVQDMRENPILVLAIGETWAMYIDTVPSDVEDPYGDAEAGKIRMGLGYFFTYGMTIAPNGTVSYKNNAQIEGQTITQDDLIAYISPNGYLKPYYNENAPKSPTLYSYLAYMERNEGVFIGLNVIASNGYDSPTVEGGGFSFEDGSEYEYNVSMDYTTEGNYVTGMNVTATSQSASTKEFSFPFTGQTPPEPYDFYWESGLYSVAFSVVESGTEETSGGSGGSDLPPALVSILMAVPIIVLAGLVFVGIKMFRMQ